VPLAEIRMVCELFRDRPRDVTSVVALLVAGPLLE
jgi:hypothetical protein